MNTCTWLWLGIVIGYFGGLLVVHLLARKRKE